MTAMSVAVFPNSSSSLPQVDFVQNILPVVTGHACKTFRRLRQDEREEAVQAATAIAFKDYKSLVEQGKYEAIRAGALARFACRQVKAGRGVGSTFNTTDVLSPAAQRTKRFTVVGFGNTKELPREYAEALGEHDRSSVADQVAFRCDFAEWLSGLSERWRTIVRRCALGHSGKDLAATFGVSPARISELRREFAQSWDRFQGEATPDGVTSSASP